MKRQAAETQASVYAYGCGEPVTGAEQVLSEHALQRAMWDALIHADNRAERAIWEAAREVPEINAAIVELDALSAQINDAVSARRAERSKARSKVDTPELDAQIATLADARKACRKTLWPLLGEWRKAHKDVLKGIEQKRRDENKAIRQQSGLYWGNYNRVIDSFERGRKLAKQRGGRMRFSDPRRTDGIIAVQIQSTKSGLGASMDELMNGGFNALQIAPVPTDIETRPRSERRKLARTILDMRVDAAGHRVTLPITIHRMPPATARIKAAQLTWRQEGERTRWQLALTIVSPSEALRHEKAGACGIDVGWRLQDDGGLLVATTWGTDNTPTRYALPARWMSAMDQVERLGSHIDDNTLELAKQWHDRVAELPDDLRQPLMGWRPRRGAGHVDSQRLHDAIQSRLVSAPKGEQVALPAGFRHWYDRYRHLRVWRDNLRAKLMRQRREHYRLFAREIATRYALVGIEKINLAEMARTKTRAPEEGDNPLHQAARAQRQRAAVHSFLAELKHQAVKAGAEVTELDPKHTTCACHVCGELVQPTDRTARVWTCTNGHTWDQDINAAKNLLDATIGAIGPGAKQAA